MFSLSEFSICGYEGPLEFVSGILQFFLLLELFIFTLDIHFFWHRFQSSKTWTVSNYMYIWIPVPTSRYTCTCINRAWHILYIVMESEQTDNKTWLILFTLCTINLDNIFTYLSNCFVIHYTLILNTFCSGWAEQKRTKLISCSLYYRTIVSDDICICPHTQLSYNKQN